MKAGTSAAGGRGLTTGAAGSKDVKPGGLSNVSGSMGGGGGTGSKILFMDCKMASTPTGPSVMANVGAAGALAVAAMSGAVGATA